MGSHGHAAEVPVALADRRHPGSSGQFTTPGAAPPSGPWRQAGGSHSLELPWSVRAARLGALRAGLIGVKGRPDNVASWLSPLRSPATFSGALRCAAPLTQTGPALARAVHDGEGAPRLPRRKTRRHTMGQTTDSETVEAVALDWDEHLNDRDRNDQWTDADDPDDVDPNGAER